MTTMLFVLAALAGGLALFGAPRRLERGERSPADADRLDAEEPDATVRIVIPARNESASIANLLGDLRDAGWPDGPRRQVVVVDDHSTDATADLARSFVGVEVLPSPPLPSGWRGKPWACETGSGPIVGLHDPDVLAFLDADVRLAPDAVDLLLAEVDRGGVISVQPYHRTATAVEQLSACFNVVSMMGIGAGTDAPRGMFGPVVVCRSTDYRRVGGHAAVRAAIAEDLALAERFRSADVDVRVLVGGDHVSFRMYPTGLRDLVDGWTKNVATGAGSVAPLRSVGVAAWITALLTVTHHTIGAIAAGRPMWTAVIWIALYALAAGCVGRLFRRVGDFRWWVAAAFPIVVGFFVVVFLRSVWRTHGRRQVVWRDRVIDLTDSRRSCDVSTVETDPEVPV